MWDHLCNRALFYLFAFTSFLARSALPCSASPSLLVLFRVEKELIYWTLNWVNFYWFTCLKLKPDKPMRWFGEQRRGQNNKDEGYTDNKEMQICRRQQHVDQVQNLGIFGEILKVENLKVEVFQREEKKSKATKWVKIGRMIKRNHFSFFLFLFFFYIFFVVVWIFWFLYFPPLFSFSLVSLAVGFQLR